MRDFTDILNPEFSPELTEITRQIGELEHSTRMKSPHFLTLQRIKNVRRRIFELLSNTEKRHTRINQAASYRSARYGRVQYILDSSSHFMGTVEFTSQVLLLKNQISKSRN